MKPWVARAAVTAFVALGLIAGTVPINYAQSRPAAIATSGDAESMDPILAAISTTTSIQQHALELLLGFDPDGKIVPALATSWKALDNLTWELKLRPNVKFHNGESFNAEAVKFSPGMVAFDYRGATHRFGALLDPEDAAAVLERLRPYAAGAAPAR